MDFVLVHSFAPLLSAKHIGAAGIRAMSSDGSKLGGLEDVAITITKALNDAGFRIVKEGE
jgi:hypothetical protein